MTEVCIVGDSGCICHDPRLDESARDYVLTFAECANFIARSPDSERIIREWALRNCTK